jgi:hypothetical protein
MSCRCRCRSSLSFFVFPRLLSGFKTGRGGSGTGFGVRCQARRRTRDRGFRGERDFGARPFEGIFPAILDSLCGDFLSSLGSKCQMITTQYVVLCSSRPRLQRLGCLFGRGARRFHRLGIRQHVPLLPACTLLAFRVCPPRDLRIRGQHCRCGPLSSPSPLIAIAGAAIVVCQLPAGQQEIRTSF